MRKNQSVVIWLNVRSYSDGLLYSSTTLSYILKYFEIKWCDSLTILNLKNLNFLMTLQQEMKGDRGSHSTACILPICLSENVTAKY